MNPRRLSIAAGGAAGVAILVLLAVCSCCVCLGAALLLVQQTGRTDYAPEETFFLQPEDKPQVQATVPVPTTEPAPDEAEETLLALELADVPDVDLHELGIRLLGVPADTPRVVGATSPDYPLGTVRTFKAANLDEDENFEVQARLVYKTDHVYMWIEEGLSYSQSDVEDAADLFEEHTYPTNREFFGSEWNPGVDGDPHLSILHASNLGRTVAGYFSGADSYVTAVREDSNELEMFYIHLNKGTDVGDPFYNGVLAHEFQHMIHWNNDRNETTWLNEGCAELAMELNNRTYSGGAGYYDVGGSEYSYLDNPDTQLNTWPEVGQTGSASPHYGASYLFMSYFLDRFGDRATQALVAHDENGLNSVDLVLQDELHLDLTHKDVFADWVVANLVDDPSLAQGQFGHGNIDVDEPAMAETYSRNASLPQTQRSTVQQYAVDYIEIESRTPVEFAFTGSTQVRLMSTDAHSGKYLWWSNRGDESDPKLTRVVDLVDAQSAELRFWSWYHIEEDWDYAYVVVGSTGSGEIPDDLSDPSITWHILDDASLGCTTTNPNNGNLGCGLTGQSQGWERLSADLGEYAGQEIAVRFEYITDAAVNQAGLAVDDITLIADGQILLDDDVEGSDGDWVAEGFVRHANVLHQDWMVQLVTYGRGDDISITRLASGDTTSGTWTIPFGSDTTRAVITVSAMAPVTTEPAVYEYTISVGP